MVDMLLKMSTELLTEHRYLIEFVNQLKVMDCKNCAEYDRVMMTQFPEDCEEVEELNDLQTTLKERKVTLTIGYQYNKPIFWFCFFFLSLTLIEHSQGRQSEVDGGGGTHFAVEAIRNIVK